MNPHDSTCPLVSAAYRTPLWSKILLRYTDVGTDSAYFLHLVANQSRVDTVKQALPPHLHSSFEKHANTLFSLWSNNHSATNESTLSWRMRTKHKTSVWLLISLYLMLHYGNSQSPHARAESTLSRPTKRSTPRLKEHREQVNGAERSTSVALMQLAPQEIIWHILRHVHLR